MVHLNIVGTIALTRICTIYVHLKETRATDPFIWLIKYYRSLEELFTILYFILGNIVKILLGSMYYHIQSSGRTVGFKVIYLYI